MSIKIFHTADVHIGMKFNKYPKLQKELQETRVGVISRMVKRANEEKCNLFVVAGDLFHENKKISNKVIHQVVSALENFEGECVLVLPGNHDYDNDMIDLWKKFNDFDSEKILFINKQRPYSLQNYDIDAVVYPAPCHSKHSDTNNIGWINEEIIDETLLNIGVAHGALKGISPDLDNKYFNMSLNELGNLPIDVWLLGHTHITYPEKDSVVQEKIFNPGTPEPDGLDCKHVGNAWIITIDSKKEVSAEKVEIGEYKFIDKNFVINDKEDFKCVENEIIGDTPSKTIARICISGKVEEEVYKYRQDVYRKIEDIIGYLIVEDSEFGIKITSENIQREFTDGSFPMRMLTSMLDDEEALQLAYEMIMEVRK
jgi:DNA repair exonuclease SbcCD nuclease subunit